MSIKVRPDDLSKEILKQMEIYTEEVERKVAEAVIKVGDQTAKGLRTVNQVAGSNVWKNYPRGWSNQKKKTRGNIINWKLLTIAGQNANWSGKSIHSSGRGFA